MICDPCAEAADLEAFVQSIAVEPQPVTHDPAICRDAAIQPAGCGCAHGQAHQQEAAA